MALFGAKPKTVDEIIQTLSKVHDDLREHAGDRLAQANEARSAANQLLATADEHEMQASRAAGIAGNLAKLLGKN